MNSKTKVIVTLEVKEGKKQDLLNILTPLSEQAKKEKVSFLMIFTPLHKILMNCYLIIYGPVKKYLTNILIVQKQLRLEKQ